MKKINLHSAYFKYILKFQILCSVFIISPTIQVKAQTLVNQIFELKMNYPDTVEWQDDVLYGSNLITCGNTWHNAAQKTNIVTTKTDQGGSIVWQTEYNGTLSGFDYGAAVTVDGSGNVFVAGATHNTSSTTFDVVVIKYNSSGVQQWATLYNGTGSDMDIPSDILLLGTDIYVCAASVGSGSAQYDYLLLKLNSSGTIQWNARYNYTNLYDIPGHLATNGTQIVVSGASQSSATNWDYTSLKYNTSGTLLNTQRNAAAGYGFDRPTGLVTDASGNFYLTGYAYNGTNYDMRTIKLNEALSPQWTKTENAGADDGANSIAIDNSGNVYIAGYSENPSGGEQMKVIKYNNSGTKLWTKTLSNIDNTYKAQATKIKWDATAGLVATGYMQTPASTKQITTFKLNTSTGNIQWKHDYNNLASSINYPTGVELSGNHIWITGQTTEDDTIRYITLKYETYEKVDEILFDTSGIPLYVKDQIIVRFAPYHVKDEFVNNTQKVYESLSNVVDAAAYSKIQPLICGRTQCNPTTVKVYKRFPKSDSISITRLGSTVKNDKLWSTMLILLPAGSDIEYILDTLNNLLPEVIYAQKNYISTFNDVPNDEFWPQQESLFSTVYPNAHINMVDGWDFEDGNSDIRVGVYDSGIDWTHEDFHLDTNDDSFADSKIEGGYDYRTLTDINLEPDNDEVGHGTRCAGIIGALRNNESTLTPTEFVGIAGVAGGDLENDGNPGSQLFAMKIGDQFGFITSELRAQAYEESYLIYGLDVTNHSYGGSAFDPVVYDAFNLMYKHEVIFVASRGNFPNLLGLELDEPSYPACYDDDKVINVGASGTDGFWKTIGNGNPGPTLEDMADNNFQSQTGFNIDVVAPGTNEIVFTTAANADGYDGFNGTSAAAPHVSGVVALMLSLYGNTLAPEDIENILQNNAWNVGSQAANLVGFGKIDAAETLEELVLPQYQVLHYSGTTGTYTEDPIATFQSIYVTDYTAGLLGPFLGNVVDVTYTFTHSIPASATLLDGWVRNSTTEGYIFAAPSTDYSIAIPQPIGSVEVLINATTAQIRTRLYKVTHSYLGFDIPDVWIPENPDQILLNYSLHIFDPLATEIEVVSGKENSLMLYPNPASEQLTVYSAAVTTNDQCEIFTADGKLIKSIIGFNFIDENRFTIDISDLPEGIYLLRLAGNNCSRSSIFIKL